MRTATIITTAASIGGVLAQTPEGFFPFQSQTSNTLGVQYGSLSVTPNALIPRDSARAQPVISSNASYPDTYMLLLVDESIPKSRFPANQSDSLAFGLGLNFTTRLHWWAGNITHSPDNTFTNSSPAIAPYNGPMPPLGDLPHTYVFYLFPQPAGYAPPNVNYSVSTARMNFSVDALGSAVQSGVLAANYFRTEFPGNNVTSNGTATSGSGSGPTASSSSTPIPFDNAASSVSLGTSAVLAGAGMLLFSML